MTTKEIKKPFNIVCVSSYEFEGIKFQVGDISDNSFGRNIPDNWRKATQKDIDNYINKRSYDYENDKTGDSVS
jgi:hypothetical protein